MDGMSRLDHCMNELEGAAPHCPDLPKSRATDSDHAGRAAAAAHVIQCTDDQGAGVGVCRRKCAGVGEVFDKLPAALESAHVRVVRVRELLVDAAFALTAIDAEVVDRDPIDANALLVLDLDQLVERSLTHAGEVPSVDVV